VKDKLAAREIKEGDTVGVFVSEKHQHASMSGLLPSVVIRTERLLGSLKVRWTFKSEGPGGAVA
jgi:hypothetical protein